MPASSEKLEKLIRKIGERPSDELVRAFLAYHEKEPAPADLKSLALDAMLVAEGDTAGEFKSKAELLERLRKLEDSSAVDSS